MDKLSNSVHTSYKTLIERLLVATEVMIDTIWKGSRLLLATEWLKKVLAEVEMDSILRRDHPVMFSLKVIIWN